MEDDDFEWAFSSSKGHYTGFKLTVALDYQTIQPLAFLIHSGSPHDSKLFEQMVKSTEHEENTQLYTC